MGSKVNTQDDKKKGTAQDENDVSEKQISLHIDHYRIRREVIEKRHAGKCKQRIEEKGDSGSILDQKSAHSHKKREKVEKCGEYEKVFCDAEMESCPFYRISKELVMQMKKRITRIFILDFIHKFI